MPEVNGCFGGQHTDLSANQVCCPSNQSAPGNPHFEGVMDELVIYDRDLTAEELQEPIKK